MQGQASVAKLLCVDPDPKKPTPRQESDAELDAALAGVEAIEKGTAGAAQPVVGGDSKLAALSPRSVSSRASRETATETTDVFELDRRQLRDLLTEIQIRLEEPQDDRIFPAIGPLVHRINNLELPQRLGFLGDPLFFTSRQDSENTTMHICTWNDPTGAGGGEVLVSHVMTVQGQTHDMMPREYHGSERHRLGPIVARWVRAVDRIDRPEPYPCRPSFLPSDWDPHLARDPLWRSLQRAIWDLTNDAKIRSGARFMETQAVWIHKINAIVAYDKICARPVFSTLILRGGIQDALQVSHPEGGEHLCLRFKAGGTLDDAALAELSERLSLWRDWRTANLKARSEALLAAEADLDAVPARAAIGFTGTTGSDKRGGGQLLAQLLDPDRPGRTSVQLTRDGVGGRAVVATIRGKTCAHLVNLVLAQPDQDHTWRDLLMTGNGAGHWVLSSADSLRRAGSRVKGQLPPSIKGHWQQSMTGVRWQS